jgi:hypothetical protein
MKPLIGALLYPARLCRPDLSFAVNLLTRKPSQALAKRILRYIRATTGEGLHYKSGVKDVFLDLFTDSDWAAETEDRKSISGHTIFLTGNLIAWGSKKQQTTALSSCEAEMYALVEGVKELIYIQNLIRDLGITVARTRVWVDNQGTIDFVNNDGPSRRMKHIDIRVHFVKEHVQAGDFELIKIASAENIADGLTKSLNKVKFREFKERLRVTEDEGSNQEGV